MVKNAVSKTNDQRNAVSAYVHSFLNNQWYNTEARYQNLNIGLGLSIFAGAVVLFQKFGRSIAPAI